PPLQPGDVLLAREPTDFARVLTQGADTARDAAALVAALRKTAEDVNRSKLVDDVSATVGKINRVVDQVEHGRGWAHALLYEEPVALKRRNETVTTTQKLLDRLAEGEGTIGALLADPTIYERLVTILEGAQRSFLLRSLIRGLGEKGAESKGDGPRR